MSTHHRKHWEGIFWLRDVRRTHIYSFIFLLKKTTTTTRHYDNGYPIQTHFYPIKTQLKFAKVPLEKVLSQENSQQLILQ